MRKIAVVYKSKRGSTKQYAEWIAEETGADLFDADSCQVAALAGYETVVFGGWVRAGGIQGLEFVRKNFKALCDKELIVFAVGLNVHEEAAQAECREINFAKGLAGMPCYFFRGAYNPAAIKGIEKGIMAMVKRFVPDDAPLKQDIENGADYVNRDEIRDIVEVLIKKDEV